MGSKAAGSLHTSSGANGLPYMHGIDLSAIQDWQRVHRRQVELEAEFSEAVMRAAAGEIGVDELEEKRKHLAGIRDLCTQVYEKAFGG